MKVMNIENPQEFLKVIDSCSGQVELVTADGDRLNLKSKLQKDYGLPDARIKR